MQRRSSGIKMHAKTFNGRPCTKYTRSTLMSMNPLQPSPRAQHLQVMVQQARHSGILNLTDCSLQLLPEAVYNINQVRFKRNNRNKPQEESRPYSADVLLQKLDVSANGLAEISHDIEKLDSLTSLSLQANALTWLPNEFGHLANLTRLNLSQNRISKLPNGFYNLVNLRYLNMSCNLIEEISRNIGNFTSLEFFDCSNNRLSMLPNSIGYLERLTKFVLAHNCITELPSTLVNMSALQKLDLQHNELIGLPKNMSHLRNLQLLCLRDNYIVELVELNGCNQLLDLYVDNNKIKRLPNKLVSSWSSLKVLRMSYNMLSEIPADIVLLQSLVELDLSFNVIKKMTSSLALLQNLNILHISGNPIAQIQSNIHMIEPSKITAMALRATITEYKTDVKTDEAHATQNPSRRALFPVTHDRRSQNADFSNRNLNELPLEFQFMCVCVVDFHGDKKRSRAPLPPFLNRFTSLTVINLQHNNLFDLPRDFAVLKNIKELNLSENKFEYIPLCVYRLKNLKILMASENRIKSIDATENGLGGLKELLTLKLRHNRLTSLPLKLGFLSNIKTLDIIGNPLEFPKQRVIRKGTKAIMSSLRHRHEKN